ncbi:Early flowering [Thalictrum thalictroides]|uniref:Early flowering n=1 Tax=Thalictrum thalictroides TaxID=46969 RepID=A0A7J6VE03_THATH|nr:Early flowering [Thalictrum thalictroides]
MKGGKDDDKNMGPMFPRLHVNDTEKGGPRAPPRNKMALYEQLSIPSQRFNSGSQTTLPAARNNAAPLVPVASLSQGGAHERPPAESDDNLNSDSSGGVYLRAKVHRSEPTSKKLKDKNPNASARLPSTAECGSFPLSNSNNSHPKNLGNDNDFSVPTYGNPGITPSSGKNQCNEDREKLTPLSPIPSLSTETSGNSAKKTVSPTCNSSTYLHSARDKHLKRTNTTDLWSRQHVRNHSEENPLESVTSKEFVERASFHPLTRENIAESAKHAYLSPNQEHRSSPFHDLGELRDNHNGQLQQEYRSLYLSGKSTQGNAIVIEPMALMGKGHALEVRSESHSRDSFRNDHGSCTEYREEQMHGLHVGDVDRNDDASETSMVDSISGFDISPDDVVGMIGQKHFWKARRAIVNQQRLFAVQVFELHRLIKVQKLIAGSPHLLLEHTAYLSKPPMRPSPTKKLISDYVVKSPILSLKQKAESQKPSQTTQCAADNAVVKAPPSISVGTDIEPVNQQSSHGPAYGDPTIAAAATPPAPPPPLATDGNKAGWSFHPPPGNQWLVPVMSPSEGLVYKPYTGHCPPTAGFMAPIYQGCGPMSIPSMANPYGISAPHHQGVGGLSNASPFNQTYFSPYAMPMMNPVLSASSVEHVNHFAGAQSRKETDKFSTGEVNFNMCSQTSRNISNQKSEANSSAFPKFQASKESEVQGSTASSPGERARKDGVGNDSGGRGALPLFPMAPAVQGPHEPPHTQDSDQQHTRVIKVVPHNPISATESAARIFQSIQEERQQYDSV